MGIRAMTYDKTIGRHRRRGGARVRQLRARDPCARFGVRALRLPDRRPRRRGRRRVLLLRQAYASSTRPSVTSATASCHVEIPAPAKDTEPCPTSARTPPPAGLAIAHSFPLGEAEVARLSARHLALVRCGRAPQGEETLACRARKQCCHVGVDVERHRSVRCAQPNALSSPIISAKPPSSASEAARSWPCPWLSGMSSSTTTYSIAPAAKASAPASTPPDSSKVA